MAARYEWSSFYLAMCEHGPHLLLGIDGYDLDDNGVREVVATIAVAEDRFWSDGLEDLLAQGANDGDLRTGVLSTLGLWRENVLMALSEDFGIHLDWKRVVIDGDSPLIDVLVEAASPAVI